MILEAVVAALVQVQNPSVALQAAQGRKPVEDHVAFEGQDPDFLRDFEGWLEWGRNSLPEPYGIMLTAGGRTGPRQHTLFKKGRKKIQGAWRIVKRWLVVTFCDGYRRRSPHQKNRKTGYYQAIDFVLTFKGHSIWYPRDDDDHPDARTTRQLYQFLCEGARDRKGLDSGHFWKRIFDPYHLQPGR